MASSTRNDSTINLYTICREWNNWIEALKECNSNQWRLAAEQAPKITATIVKEWSKAEPIQEASSPLTSVNEQSHGSSSSVTELSHTSQSSTSSSTLSSGALDNIKSEFSTNFRAFQGSPWLLSTGTNGLFQEKLEQDDLHEAERSLLEWKQKEIMRYSEGPDKIKEILLNGWKFSDEDSSLVGTPKSEIDGFREDLHQTMLVFSRLYREYNNELPKYKSEAWYVKKVWDSLFSNLVIYGSEWIEFAPGEICSSASSARQNENRNLEIRQACGSKVDGLITCKKSNYEIGAIEVGDIDEGLTGTKALKDSRKLAKLLKDMFEAICNNCKSETNIRSELRRYYHLKRERTMVLSSSWDENGIRTLLMLVSMMLFFRERMEAMSKLIYNRVSPENDDIIRFMSGLDQYSSPPTAHVKTLSTPKSIPKSRRDVPLEGMPQQFREESMDFTTDDLNNPSAEFRETLQDLQDTAGLAPHIAWGSIEDSLQEVIQHECKRRTQEQKCAATQPRRQRQRQHLLRRIPWYQRSQVARETQIEEMEREVEDIERRLDGLQAKGMERLAIRAQVKWREVGERCT
ncbi:hypothetical protein BGZ46_007371 [Entomortierella lignicola]|nr:hypothetical protein BGZ46_007371 [Entomortierella lignicola]